MPEKGPLTCWRQLAAFPVSKWGSWWPVGNLSMSAFRCNWNHLNLISGSPSKLYMCAKTQKIADCWYGGQNVQNEAVFRQFEGANDLQMPWKSLERCSWNYGIHRYHPPPLTTHQTEMAHLWVFGENPKNAKKQKVFETGSKLAWMTLKGP